MDIKKPGIPAEIVKKCLEHEGMSLVDNQQTADRAACGINSIGILGEHPAGHLCKERLPEQLPTPSTMTTGIQFNSAGVTIKNNGPGISHI